MAIDALQKIREQAVNVLVNGTQEGSFTQTAPSKDYDVSVSDGTSSINMTADHNGALATTDGANTAADTFFENPDLPGSNNSISVSVNVTSGDESVDWTLEYNGTQVDSASLGTNSSATLTHSTSSPSTTDSWRVTIDTASSIDFDRDGYTATVTQSFDVNSGFSVDGVTQS